MSARRTKWCAWPHARNLWVPTIGGCVQFGRWAFVEISDPREDAASMRRVVRSALQREGSEMANGAKIAQHIVRTPGVAGGSARIRDTRIPVWLVVHWSRLGWEPWRIRKEYEESGVTDEDVLAALDYATAHPDEIARDLEEQDDDEDLA